MKKKIEYDRECKSCKGTGIYVGLAERDGAGVVCHTCNGTGCEHIIDEFEEFTSRKIANEVIHVLAVNPGICVGVGKDRQYKLSDFGGMSYKDWFNEKSFPPKSEMRKFTCPVWWYQSADYKKKPDWGECGWGTFSSCQHFVNKNLCWERWDRAFNQEPANDDQT